MANPWEVETPRRIVPGRGQPIVPLGGTTQPINPTQQPIRQETTLIRDAGDRVTPENPALKPPVEEQPPGKGSGGSGSVGTPGASGKGGTGGTPPPEQPPTGGGKGGTGTPALGSATPNQPGGTPMLPDPYAGRGFADPHIRPVAGVNPYQEWAAGLLPGMIGPTALEGQAADLIGQGVAGSQQRVTGAGLPGGPEGTNPTFEATRRAFEAVTIPQIRQQRTLMGLGDSNAVTNDISRAWAGVLPTLVENELGREERGINRGVSGAFTGASGLQGLSGQQGQREFGAIDRGFGFGTGFRGIADEANRAIYEDFLRRQGMAERLLFAPFGGANSTIGSETEMGGLFK
jgi:hypothetical protein